MKKSFRFLAVMLLLIGTTKVYGGVHTGHPNLPIQLGQGYDPNDPENPRWSGFFELPEKEELTALQRQASKISAQLIRVQSNRELIRKSGIGLDLYAKYRVFKGEAHLDLSANQSFDETKLVYLFKLTKSFTHPETYSCKEDEFIGLNGRGKAFLKKFIDNGNPKGFLDCAGQEIVVGIWRAATFYYKIEILTSSASKSRELDVQIKAKWSTGRFDGGLNSFIQSIDSNSTVEITAELPSGASEEFNSKVANLLNADRALEDIRGMRSSLAKILTDFKFENCPISAFSTIKVSTLAEVGASKLSSHIKNLDKINLLKSHLSHQVYQELYFALRHEAVISHALRKPALLRVDSSGNVDGSVNALSEQLKQLQAYRFNLVLAYVNMLKEGTIDSTNSIIERPKLTPVEDFILPDYIRLQGWKTKVMKPVDVSTNMGTDLHNVEVRYYPTFDLVQFDMIESIAFFNKGKFLYKVQGNSLEAIRTHNGSMEDLFEELSYTKKGVLINKDPNNTPDQATSAAKEGAEDEFKDSNVEIQIKLITGRYVKLSLGNVTDLK